jgi:hypothetical protein
MPIESFFQGIAQTELATAVRESTLAYPIILSLHLTCIGFIGGMILMTNLRLLGISMSSTPASEVIARLRPWKHVGGVVMVSCGLLLAAAKANEYVVNPYFLLKMCFLAAVIAHHWIFRGSVYGRGAPATGSAAKWAGLLSIVLWIGVLSAGRWIGYYEPGE